MSVFFLNNQNGFDKSNVIFVFFAGKTVSCEEKKTIRR